MTIENIYRLQELSGKVHSTFQETFPYTETYACPVCKIGFLRQIFKLIFKCTVCQRDFNKQPIGPIGENGNT